MSTAKSRKRMLAAVASLRGYVLSYDRQHEFENYTDATFIDDVIYGLGVALDPQAHSYAQGFEAFKAKLRSHLAGGAQEGADHG